MCSRANPAEVQTIKILGVGEFGATNAPGDVVKTFALGSCVAVILLHKKMRTVGMLHLALPDSTISKDGKIMERPGYFADTGIPALIALMQSMGCAGPGRGAGLTVKLAGGANVMDTNDIFKIGKRNILSAKKILWSYGLAPIAEDVGGNISRTVSVLVATGEVILSSPVRGEWKI